MVGAAVVGGRVAVGGFAGCEVGGGSGVLVGIAVGVKATVGDDDVVAVSVGVAIGIDVGSTVNGVVVGNGVAVVKVGIGGRGIGEAGGVAHPATSISPLANIASNRRYIIERLALYLVGDPRLGDWQIAGWCFDRRVKKRPGN